LLYYHHQSTAKPSFAIISVFRLTVAVSQNVFAVSKVKPLRKLWRGPQYFVNVGSVASENASGLRGFEVQRRYQNSIARMVVVFSSV